MSDDGESPYRVAQRFLACPRCDEVLEEAFEGVHACLRCAGVWIMQPAIDTTFGDPRWPLGHAAWWHRALECPECGADGTPKVMDASIVDEVIVDRCRGHGVWLDEGELARVLGLPSTDRELAALQKLVAPASAIDPAARLAARGRDREAQRLAMKAMREQAAKDLAARVAERLLKEREESARAKEEEQRTRVKEQERRARAQEEERHARANEQEAREAEQRRTQAELLKQARGGTLREERQHTLIAERATAVEQVHALEEERVALERQMAQLRHALAQAETKLYATRDRIITIDNRLAALAEEP